MNIQYFQMVEIRIRKAEMAQACEYMEKFGYKVQTIVYEGDRLRIQAIKKGTRGDVNFDELHAVKVDAPAYVFD